MRMTLWQRDTNWIAAEFADNLVMLDVESGNYFGMNKTAAAIWTTLEQPCTIATVVDRLRGQFDVPADRCTVAVTRILDELKAIGAIRTA